MKNSTGTLEGGELYPVREKSQEEATPDQQLVSHSGKEDTLVQ
jgi:hypothetical protein